jgi:aryl-alcohol dehydrogenase-like predicted oxidoreductase
MEYRNLGRTGVPVSILCVGCMNFGGATPEDESIQIIHRALDEGINFFDTANVYTRGISEEVTGKALKGRRDKIVLATKVHGRMSDDVLDYGNSRRHIIEQCEASLKRLQTDYIDLYQIHRPQADIPIDETLRALDDLIRAGKVRYIGTSSYAAWQVMESLWVAKELGLNRFVSEQPPYNLMDRSIERELIPMAQTYGIALIPWSPLARGFLTGKYRRGEELPEGSRLERDMGSGRSTIFSERTKKHLTDRAFDVLDVVEALANAKGATPSQIALAWMLRQPAITSPIIGPRTMEHLVDNLGAVGIEITDADREKLDSVAPPEEATASYYNSRAMDFKPPQYRW